MFIFLLIFIVSKKAFETLCWYTIAMAMIFYYVLWTIYFACMASLLILLGMAILTGVGIEINEAEDECLRRDLIEETGYNINIGSLFLVEFNMVTDQDHKDI